MSKIVEDPREENSQFESAVQFNQPAVNEKTEEIAINKQESQSSASDEGPAEDVFYYKFDEYKK